MATPSSGRPSVAAPAKSTAGMLSPPATARAPAPSTSTSAAAGGPSLVRGVSTVTPSSTAAATGSRTFQPGPPSAPPPSATSSGSRPASSPANGGSGSNGESGSGDAFMNRLAKLGGVDIKSSGISPPTPSAAAAAAAASTDDEETIRKREHQRMIIGMMGEEAANAEEKKFQLLEREELKIPQFSKALETAIQEVVGGEGALDRPNFDPVDYINAEFPDEKSLTGAKLDATLTLQRQHMLTLSETIAKEVRDHSTQKSRTRKAIKSATNSIKDLVSKIKHIKEKADESEKMVLQISTDLRSLDCAKKHLTRSSQALRNLHMLTSLSSLLESAINEKRYRDAAGQMQGVTVVVTEFEKYKDVANIRSLISHVDLMKERVRTQITKDFYNMGVAGADGKPSVNSALLLDACAVLDALGGDAKASILKWFCKSQLEAYTKEYKPGTDAGMVENIANRYAVCSELLDKYDRTYAGVFPRAWDVPAILAREFSIITRDHLTILLKQNQPEVEIFRQIVGKTIDFETTLCLKFRDAKIGDVSIHFEGSEDKKAVINALKNRYKREPTASISDSKDGGKPGEKHVSSIVFEHIISEVFTPYMAILVEWEKQKVDQLIAKWRVEERWPEAKADSAPGALRLTSSNELFLYIRNSIKRITKLARDQTFFHMFRVYRSGISSYVDMLDARLPARAPAGRNEEKPCGRGELQQMCVIVNTAEYCYDTLPPFGESVRKQVDDVFKNDVDLEQQRQEFNELIGKVLNALANSVSLRLSRALQTMLAMKWSQMENTGDQSGFVTEIQQSLIEDVAFIGGHIVARKHAIFCSSWVRSFVPKFVEAIFKIKGITEMGGNQLLIDVTMLRKILLEAPFVGMSEEVKAPSKRAFMLFNKYVTEEMLKVENLLKVINSPNERIVLRFKTMLTHMKPEDLAKIMAVKGLKKPYMMQLINDYNKGVPETERLVVAQVLPPSSMSVRLGQPFAGIKFP